MKHLHGKTERKSSKMNKCVQRHKQEVNRNKSRRPLALYQQCVCKCFTLKQLGHMVMLTSGSRERKYSHLSGLGQRLIRTSRLLMERSTERLTLTGTKVEPPCCLDTQMNTNTPSNEAPLFHPLQLVCPAGRILITSSILSFLSLPQSSFWL